MLHVKPVRLRASIIRALECGGPTPLSLDCSTKSSFGSEPKALDCSTSSSFGSPVQESPPLFSSPEKGAGGGGVSALSPSPLEFRPPFPLSTFAFPLFHDLLPSAFCPLTGGPDKIVRKVPPTPAKGDGTDWWAGLIVTDVAPIRPEARAGLSGLLEEGRETPALVIWRRVGRQERKDKATVSRTNPNQT